jgi:hypothetical protein
MKATVGFGLLRSFQSETRFFAILTAIFAGANGTLSAPANDNFANRIGLGSSGGTVTGSNVGATKEAGEPNHAGNVGGKSVWWTWTPSASGNATISTAGSSFDTILAVYTGTTIPTLTQVAANDDVSTNNHTSQVTFGAVSGVTYQIAVDGFNGASGNITLVVTPPSQSSGGPPNDNFANRATVPGAGGTMTANNSSATKEPGEPNHGGNKGGASLWWTWTAPGNGSVIINTAGSSFDTELAVYTGSSVSSLISVASNDDVSHTDRTSLVTFDITKGTTYQIAVDGFNKGKSVATGSVTLTVTLRPSVVLLLHGMNSDPDTWKDFIGDPTYFPNNAAPIAPVIYGGIVQTTQGTTPTPDINNVLYYRVKFGAYDQVSGPNSGRTGVEGITSSGNTGGDFTSFFGPNSLAQEVQLAVAKIMIVHPNAKILLVGHSRGGIAGRAFMQTTTYPERTNIVGLITVGTPHLGSPFGQLYGYLLKNPRPGVFSSNSDLINDWNLVDELDGSLLLYPKKIDVRRPTIGDLAQSSPQIAQLAKSIGNLPSYAKYGALKFNAVPFGLLSQSPSYNVFTGGTWYVTLLYGQLSPSGSNYVSQSKSIDPYVGDGIVPFANQTFSAKKITLNEFTNSVGIIHTEEPKQKSDIHSAMKNIVNWWN